jgi:hypothetical protein
MDRDQAVNEMNALMSEYWASVEKRRGQRLEQISRLQAEFNTDFGKLDELKREAEGKVNELRTVDISRIADAKSAARSAIQRLQI